MKFKYKGWFMSVLLYFGFCILFVDFLEGGDLSDLVKSVFLMTIFMYFYDDLFNKEAIW